MNNKSINSFGKHGWWIIFYVLLLFWFSASPVDLLNVSVDAFAGMKSWDGNLLLVFSSVGMWVGIAAVAIFGRWVAAKGAKLPTIIGLVLLGVFFILNGFANSIPMYGVAVVLLTAMSGCINLVRTNTFMSNWFPKKKGIALGWSSMGMCVSSGISIPVFAALLQSTHTLTIPFALFGIITIAIAVITGFFVKEWPEQADAFPDNEEISQEQMKRNRELTASYKSEWTPKKLFRCSQMWLVSVTFGLLFIALMATMTQFVPRFMAAGFTNGEAIMWLTITAVLGVIGSYLWGYLDQKTNTKLTVVIYAVYMMAMQFLRHCLHEFTNKEKSGKMEETGTGEVECKRTIIDTTYQTKYGQ